MLTRRLRLILPALVLARPVYAQCLNAQDFQCFLNRFAQADPWANCDGSQVGPSLNANDFQCFLNKFAGSDPYADCDGSCTPPDAGWTDLTPGPNAHVWYVSVAGSDANPGTQAQPLRTLQRGEQLAAPGDQVLLQRGDTFAGGLTLSKDRITIASWGSGSRPIVSSAEGAGRGGREGDGGAVGLWQSERSPAMAKRKAVVTQDGKPVRVGMKVWTIRTQDRGETWSVGPERKIGEVRRGPLASVTLLEGHSTLMFAGESRILSSERAAQREVKKRNTRVEVRELPRKGGAGRMDKPAPKPGPSVEEEARAFAERMIVGGRDGTIRYKHPGQSEYDGQELAITKHCTHEFVLDTARDTLAKNLLAFYRSRSQTPTPPSRA